MGDYSLVNTTRPISPALAYLTDLSHPHQFTMINIPNAKEVQPFSINNYGHIAGGYVDANGSGHGFLLANDLGQIVAFVFL